MKIDLKGIASNISPLNTNGTAQDVIGLRNKHGEWTRIPAAKDVLYLDNTPNGQSYYIHYMDSTKYYWGYHPETNEVFRYDKFGGDYTVALSLKDGETFYSFIHFGNFLMVNASLGSYKFIFDDGKYVELPELPKLRWNIETDEREKLTNNKQDAVSDPDIWQSDVLSLIQLSINEAEKNGKTQGHTLFILAFKTVTGEYIMPTAIQYNYLGSLVEDSDVNTTTFEDMITYGRLNQSITRIDTSVGGEYGKPKVTINLPTSDYNDIMKYDGLINGIAVFMTAPKSDYSLDLDDTEYISYDGIGNIKHWTVFFDNDITADDLLSNSISFYKVGDFDLVDLVAGENNKTFDVDSLETKEVLTSSISHQISGKAALDYNDRIHLGNITNKLTSVSDLSIDDTTKSYAYSNPQCPSSGYDTPGYPLFIIVKLKIDNQVKVVKTEVSEITKSSSLTYAIMNPILSYPDSRAYEMDIVRLKDGVYEKVYETVTLKPHDSLNIAYHVGSIHRESINYTFPGANDPVSTGVHFNILRYLELYYETDSGTVDEPTDDRQYQDKNRMQLSANSDPLSWPAANSYRIGRLDQEIKSMAVNSIQLSEGQFGEHPLFVFSESGIWALVKGTDSIYSNKVPVSTDVILNNKSVQTKIGVVFASEKGIVLQSGRDSVVLSGAIEGYFDNLIKGVQQFVSLTDDTYGFTLKDYLTSSGELDWGKAVIGYDYINDELYVSFTSLYTFIYNTLSKQWYKRLESWEELMLDEGNLIGVMEGQYKNINLMPTTPEGNQEFIYVSNPISLDNTKLKKYYNVTLPYYAKNMSNSYTLGLYVFGSNNLEEWKMIAGKRFKQTKLIRLNKVRASAKYHIFVIVGNQYHPNFNEVDINFI